MSEVVDFTIMGNLLSTLWMHEKGSTFANTVDENVVLHWKRPPRWERWQFCWAMGATHTILVNARKVFVLREAEEAVAVWVVAEHATLCWDN